MESDININVEESEMIEDLTPTPEDDVADICANNGRSSGT